MHDGHAFINLESESMRVLGIVGVGDGVLAGLDGEDHQADIVVFSIENRGDRTTMSDARGKTDDLVTFEVVDDAGQLLGVELRELLGGSALGSEASRFLRVLDHRVSNEQRDSKSGDQTE